MGTDGEDNLLSGNPGIVAAATAVGMDLEETPATEDTYPKRTSLQSEAAKPVGKTTICMQKIAEEGEDDSDNEILGMKTRHWKKINLSLATKLEGEDTQRTVYWHLAIIVKETTNQ
jgi:hypothetical protein